MANTASKLIEIAKAEVGYLEKRNNSNLDSKTANAGRGNYTKYARDLHDAGYYNGNKNGYAWCDVFVDWLFYQLCGKDAKKAQEIICQTGDLGAGCVYSAQYYRNAGRFHASPKVGDQIFFGARGDEDHTGIVYKVDATKVYTIEGNTSGASGVIANGGGVCEKSYPLNYSEISGYGRPKYDAEVKTTEKNLIYEFQQAAIADSLPLNVYGADGIWGKETANAASYLVKHGSVGLRVKLIQTLLIEKGHNLRVYGADAHFGDETEAAVKAYQKKNGLSVDGIVGINTWKSLLGV